MRKEDELVEIELYCDDDRYRDDVSVTVNGTTCLIKRGEPVKIKRKYAEVLEASVRQDRATAQLIKGLSR